MLNNSAHWSFFLVCVVVERITLLLFTYLCCSGGFFCYWPNNEQQCRMGKKSLHTHKSLKTHTCTCTRARTHTHTDAVLGLIVFATVILVSGNWKHVSPAPGTHHHRHRGTKGGRVWSCHWWFKCHIKKWISTEFKQQNGEKKQWNIDILCLKGGTVVFYSHSRITKIVYLFRKWLFNLSITSVWQLQFIAFTIHKPTQA